jgi:DNA-binding transcriptional LysR family regulator
MDLDLRKLRYFAALAEQQHFGRAAAQLYIAQPVLSRQIRALERELGCALLERTTRSVQLTPAGVQLRTEVASLLDNAEAVTRRTLEAARDVRRVVVGFAPGLRVSELVRAFSAAHPDVLVEPKVLDWFDQAEALRDGRADVGLLRRPFDDDSVRTIAVGSEPQVVVLPARHRLATRRKIRRADLSDEPVLHATARRTSSVEEKFELIASGRGVACLPRSVARYYARPDLVHRLVSDAEPYEICLATPTVRIKRHIREFLAMAERLLAENPPA